jgi:tetratricopeptide (TPR) repeat protein
VSGTQSRQPWIVDLYEQYLVDHNRDDFARGVADRYAVATLERLCEQADRMGRRAAVLALGFLADYSSNAVLGRALLDRDRGVRHLADEAIRHTWVRLGNAEQREQLQRVMRLNLGKKYGEAIRGASTLIRQAPRYDEAWNQRPLAHFNRGEFDESIGDCHQTLEINPYHFPAATGMGKCYLQLHNRVAALEAFRRALRLNPGLDDVRAHVVYLQRALKEE